MVQKRFLALLLVVVPLAALVAFCLWYLLAPLPPPETPRAASAPVEVEAPAPAPPAEAPAAFRSLLGISGLVLEAGCRPVSDVTIRCGEETAAVTPTGAFVFPEALRSRTATVQVLRASTVLSQWTDVVVGDAESEAVGMPDTESGGLPARPLRIRWTLNLIDVGGEGGPKSPSGGAQAESPWLEITQSFCEEYGQGARVRVMGRSRLPEGACVSVSLYFEGMRFISGEPAEVRGGAFEAKLVCPSSVNLYSARYTANASYNAVLQTFEMKEVWAKSHPGTDWETLYAEATKDVCVGDPAEASREDQRVREYYSRVLDEAAVLDEELKSRVEEVLDLGRGWDLQRLRRDMEGVSFEDIVARSRNLNPALLKSRREARQGWFYTPVVKDGQFQESAWRHFLDEEWRPRLEALIEEHAGRRQEKYPEAASRMGALLTDAILRESFAFSRFVVYPSYLPKHENDFYFDEDTVGDLVRFEGILRDNFAKLARYRRIGLEEK